jgi:hypothetical protein
MISNGRPGTARFPSADQTSIKVRAYIARQKEHHREMSFRDEYLEFLKRHDYRLR